MSNYPTERKYVLDLLKLYSVKVAAPGEEFTLASGGKSRFYVDVKKAALHADVHLPLATLLYDELEYRAIRTFGPVEAVAGVALGGCHLASIVAMYAILKGRTKLHVAYVRQEAKDHGTKNLVERPLITPDQHIVLLEDVVTTGGSSLKAIRQLRENGYDVRGTIAVIDRRPVNERVATIDGLPFRSLYTLDEFEE